MKVIFSPSALSDLQSISDDTFQTWGAEQEELYLRGMWEKIAEIQFCPDGCRLRDDLANGCRSVRYEKHVIFFMFEIQTLRVIRILQGAMDLGRHSER